MCYQNKSNMLNNYYIRIDTENITGTSKGHSKSSESHQDLRFAAYISPLYSAHLHRN